MKKQLITLFLSGLVIVANAAPTILSIKESIKDNAIVFPESFETDTHELMKNWYLQNYTVLDENVDFRQNKSVSDEEYIKRLKALPTVIEMPYNQIVKSYINMYTEKRRSLVESMLGMSLYYMPIFEQALEKEGLPLELKYLPVIESALNPNAISRVGATGLWQFMLGTAKGLGLEVNSLVDERRDPYRSSEKAAKYLKELYNIYGDWSLAIASYNCGPGNVNKALRRCGGKKKDFWDIYYYLPAETRGYVPAFIAANYVMTYFNLHNISPALAKRPLITDTIHVTKRVHLKQISEVLNIPLEEIKVLNPHFRCDIIPGDIRPYALSLPSQQVYSYIMSEDSIVAHNADLYARRTVAEPAFYSASGAGNGYERQLVVKYHTVKRGESLSKIAKRYGVSVSNLKKWNRLRRSTIRRGARLKINTYKLVRVSRPDDNEEVASKNMNGKANSKEIAKTTHIENSSEDTLEKPLKGSLTSDSQEVAEAPKEKKSNKKKATQKRKPAYKYHTVRKGENLSKIAAKYNGVSVADIKKVNNMSGTRIKAGQKLKIPKG